MNSNSTRNVPVPEKLSPSKAKILLRHSNEDLALGTPQKSTIPWMAIVEKVRSTGVQAFVEDAGLLGFLLPFVDEETSLKEWSLATVWLAKSWKNKYIYHRRLVARKTLSSAPQITLESLTQPPKEELPSRHYIRRFVALQPDV
ncbi:hypothetical protein [Absidia glauca]|uniref:Uncharacterized protein n=1 Tax=Absidia glauca TaxID=4829 RepID=A0A168QDE0_ABSGL|nr:hypothetical protein [Absidia glauca]